ncbi:hypothetical protein SDC9_62780 [bioreactor metagenome]|uniref:Uncharacterized protein n=1 Tax=bioreactor metagenome TaxID=1076179 RepID=A0A644XKN0_9ZZZZ
MLEDGEIHDWSAVLEELLIQISFFQHERLIHLIVTVTFALLEMIATALTLIFFSPAVLALCLLILVLLVPYVMHYYLLENEVQKLYARYDRILAMASGAKRI